MNNSRNIICFKITKLLNILPLRTMALVNLRVNKFLVITHYWVSSSLPRVAIVFYW